MSVLDESDQSWSGPMMAVIQGVERRLGRLWHMDESTRTRMMRSSSWADVRHELWAVVHFTNRLR